VEDSRLVTTTTLPAKPETTIGARKSAASGITFAINPDYYFHELSASGKGWGLCHISLSAIL
jgi:hypothetical protein